MKCVTNTSPISWLERTGNLDLLIRLYDEIYAPPLVFGQLRPHYPTRDFVDEHLRRLELSNKKVMIFDELVGEWFHRLRLDDKGEVEVFVSYKYFLDVDEMLFANKDAERAFKRYGSVRDISRLYELAEEQGIFTRADSISFLESFLRLERPYRTRHIEDLLNRLKRP